MSDIAEILDALGFESAAQDGQDWQPHPSFTGVALKTLLDGKESDGSVSCHLVKVQPGCGLLEHTHPKSDEVHHVLAGGGQAWVGDARTTYQPGRVNFIPMANAHGVTAGDAGLLLLAVFTPVLA